MAPSCEQSAILFLFFAVLGMESRALHMLGKGSTTESYPNLCVSLEEVMQNFQRQGEEPRRPGQCFAPRNLWPELVSCSWGRLVAMWKVDFLLLEIRSI